MSKATTLVQLLVLLLAIGLAGCQAYHVLDAAGSAPAAVTTSAESTTGSAPAATDAGEFRVQPAPAGMGRAEARRFYAAQLAAYKAQATRKVKNSGNTTTHYEQRISNVSPLLLSAALGLAVLLGGVAGLLLGLKIGRVRSLV